MHVVHTAGGKDGRWVCLSLEVVAIVLMVEMAVAIVGADWWKYW